MISSQDLIAFFAPWQKLYEHSKMVSTTVTAAHILAMFGGGGLAVAADRSVLRAMNRGPEARLRQLEELHSTHRPVLIAMSVLFLSGVALAVADLETFLGSAVFWLKLGLVFLLCVNGLLLQRAERRLLRSGGDEAGPWAALRRTGWLSISLWTVTLVVSVVLVDAA